jgi:hypothetical protein
MAIMVRLQRFAAAAVLVCLGLSVVLAAAVAEYRARIPDHDYLPEVLELQREGRTGEGPLLAVAEYVASQSDLPHAGEIEEIAQGVRKERDSVWRSAADFFRGAVTGRSESTSGLVGAAATDLLVLGDIRDLVIEAGKYARDEDPDEVIVALSALGVATSAASLAPEPTTKAAVPVELGLSVLKVLRKAGSMTAGLAADLRRLGETGNAADRLKSLHRVASDISQIHRRAPEGTLPLLLARAQSVDDVAELRRMVDASPTETVVALTLRSRPGIPQIRALGPLGRAGLSRALRKGTAAFAGLGKFERLGKFIYRGRLGEVFFASADVLTAASPRVRLWAGVAAALAALLGLSLFPWPARRRRASRRGDD